MKEHKYLDIHKNAKNASVWLAVIMVITLIIGAVTVKGAHNTLSNIFFCIGSAFAAILAAFVMHYVKHNSNDIARAKQKAALLHFYALHAIFTAAALFSGELGTFSFAVIHAICDGLLVAMVVMLLFCAFGKKGGAVSIIIGLIAAVLSLLFLDKVIMLLHIAAIILGFAFCFSVFKLLPKEAYKLFEKNENKIKEDASEKTKAHHADKASSEEAYAKDKHIIKRYQDLSAQDLLSAPVDALYGVSERDAKLLGEAFGIKTVGDLADNKFFKWAEAIVEEADK